MIHSQLKIGWKVWRGCLISCMPPPNRKQSMQFLSFNPMPTTGGSHWEYFNDEFRKKYVLKSFRDAKKNEFLALRQGNMTVMEYEREFTRLSRYAIGLVTDEDDKIRRFKDGLNYQIRLSLAPQRITSYLELVKAAEKVERIWKEILDRDRDREFKRPAFSAGPSVPKRGRSKGQSSIQTSRPGSTFRRPAPNRPAGSVASAPLPIQRGPAPPVCETCGKRHSGACQKLTGACFKCGSPDHFLKDCPSIRGTTGLATSQYQSTASGTSRGRGGRRSVNQVTRSETINKP